MKILETALNLCIVVLMFYFLEDCIHAANDTLYFSGVVIGLIAMKNKREEDYS